MKSRNDLRANGVRLNTRNSKFNLPDNTNFATQAEIEKPSITDVECIEAGDLLAAYLQNLGVEYVFGIYGEAFETFYSALARSKRSGGPTAVIARHESGAAFMAQGYSRNSGLLGVCCSTASPGATNLLTGVVSAYEGGIPMLVITVQKSTITSGKKTVQEVDFSSLNTIGIFEYCTHYNSLISHIDQFEHKLASAILTAYNNKGPVHLCIPDDILKSKVDLFKPSYDISRLIQKRYVQDEAAVLNLFGELIQSKKSVFIISSDCIGAMNEILKVANHVNATLVTTPDGKGLVNPFHPRFRGVISFAGHSSAEKSLRDDKVDTILTIGSNMAGWVGNGLDAEVVLNRRMIHVSANASLFTQFPMARMHVRGNIRKIFATLIRELLEWKPKKLELYDSYTLDHLADPGIKREKQFEILDADKCFDDSSPLKPQWLMTQLTELFPPNTRYLSDLGNALAWSIHYLHPYDRRIIERRLNTAAEIADRRTKTSLLYQLGFKSSTMGWAIGTSVGVSLASPKDPVVCIVSDGAFLMSGQEITVALELDLSIIYIVVNDASLRKIGHEQQLSGVDKIQNSGSRINFKKLAESMGAASYAINDAQDLRSLNIEEIVGRSGPTLLDIHIDAKECPPVAIREEILDNAR